MKISFQFVSGFLAAIFLAVFLSWSYFQPASQAPVQAVEDVGQFEPQGGGFGEVRCDRIIPIGEPIEGVVRLMANILVEQQNAASYVRDASSNLESIYALLNKDKEFVCDFTKCMPVALDFGPEFTLEIDALVKTITLSGHAPIPAEKDCAGSPCPVLGDDKSGPIAAISNILASLEESRGRVKAMFDDPTVVVNEDIAQMVPVDANDLSKGYTSDLGKDITQAEAIRRKTALAAAMIRDCSLSEVEKKMVLSGRMGDKYPVSCKAAIDAGQYWPMPWSEVCKAECDDGEGSDACIKCLEEKTPSLAKVSILGKLNYRIYHKDQCGPKCKNPDTGDWGLSDACLECLCTEYVYPSEGTQGPPVPVQMSDEKCMAFLCGGSKHNWTCCHQTPIDFSVDTGGYISADHHPGEDISFSPEDSNAIDTTSPPGAGTSFSLTSYSYECFPEHKCSSRGTEIGFGQIAVDPAILPYKTKVRFTSIIEAASNGKAPKAGAQWVVDSYKPGGQEILWNSNTPSGQYFCACDAGGDIKGNRIDLWLPTNADADNFGRRIAMVETIEFNSPDCCAGTHKCCQKSNLQNAAYCQSYSDDNLTGYICEPDNLKKCKRENKSEADNVLKNWCKKYYGKTYDYSGYNSW
ncbi:MAG: 3D domain-containing protein [Candidatus Pacebacteria bacterium]|nr:3D domain-containing protein [Candidatus Paceibacterota bacterium]